MGNETTNFPQPPYQAGSSMYSATAPPPSPPGSAASPQYDYIQGPPYPGGMHLPEDHQMLPPQPATDIPASHPGPTAPPHPEPAPAPAPEAEAKRTPREKIVVTIVAALLSLLVIGLTYATFLASEDIIPNPEGPLSSSVIFTLIALVTSMWLCFQPSTRCALGGLVPVILSITAGALLVLYFGSVQSWKNTGDLPDLNFGAVLTSAGVFGGMAFGSLITYFMFAHNE